MDLRKLKTLIDLVQQSGIAELEITEGEEKVRISRGISTPQATVTPAAAATVSVPAPAAESAPVTPPAEEGNVIKSPMVGTFYAAAEPGAKPYTAVGARVTKGQVLCIIEAMKIMNEIEAEVSGVVKEVCVDDAHPVEYGQVLFRVDPNG